MNFHSLLSFGHPFLQVFSNLCYILILVVLRLWIELSLQFFIHSRSQCFQGLDSLSKVTLHFLDIPLYLLDLRFQQLLSHLLVLFLLTLHFALIPLGCLFKQVDPSKYVVHARIM